MIIDWKLSPSGEGRNQGLCPWSVPSLPTPFGKSWNRHWWGMTGFVAHDDVDAKHWDRQHVPDTDQTRHLLNSSVWGKTEHAAAQINNCPRHHWQRKQKRGMKFVDPLPPATTDHVRHRRRLVGHKNSDHLDYDTERNHIYRWWANCNLGA